MIWSFVIDVSGVTTGAGDKADPIDVIVDSDGDQQPKSTIYPPIEEDMNEEELKIARSTPNYLFEEANPI